MERHLAAIVALDVVGYSRLMEIDEAGTLTGLKACRDDLVEPLIGDHGGRIVKLMGDGLLAEFSSVVEAVACAVEIQNRLADDKADVDEDRRLMFRIGINLGDVIAEGDDIYGDGVNVAARLEALADPGGICVSDIVQRSVGSKLDLAFEDLGPQKVKNLATPVHAYRVNLDLPAPLAARDDGALPLPDKPSIVVLPFANMSGDPEQEFFADGITEDLITRLSLARDLFVISRSSSFVYKGQSVRVERVARELGVHHVLEGSVRKAGNRVRITAQLINGLTGGHVWAERFDRDLTDIFAVQDEITHAIAVAMQVHLTEGDMARINAGGTRDLAAWEDYVQGMRAFLELNKIDNARARRLLESALARDPDFLAAKFILAFTYWVEAAVFLHQGARAPSLDEARRLTEAIEQAGGRTTDSESLWSCIYLVEGSHEQALQAGRRAVELGPSNSWAYQVLSMVEMYAGRDQAALVSIRTAMRLSPFCPNLFHYYLCHAHMWLGEHAEAIDAARDYGRRLPDDPWAVALLALAYGMAGERARAEQAVKDLMSRHPSFTNQEFCDSHFYEDVGRLSRVRDILREAGLPD